MCVFLLVMCCTAPSEVIFISTKLPPSSVLSFWTQTLSLIIFPVASTFTNIPEVYITLISLLFVSLCFLFLEKPLIQSPDSPHLLFLHYFIFLHPESSPSSTIMMMILMMMMMIFLLADKPLSFPSSWLPWCVCACACVSSPIFFPSSIFSVFSPLHGTSPVIFSTPSRLAFCVYTSFKNPLHKMLGGVLAVHYYLAPSRCFFCSSVRWTIKSPSVSIRHPFAPSLSLSPHNSHYSCWCCCCYCYYCYCFYYY